ncbi:MAG: hypothetical protein GY851_35655 [bacterium]|nr:hypothetical protein [bacterium]
MPDTIDELIAAFRTPGVGLNGDEMFRLVKLMLAERRQVSSVLRMQAMALDDAPQDRPTTEDVRAFMESNSDA